MLFDGGVYGGAGGVGVGLRAVGGPFEVEVKEALESGLIYYGAIGGLLDGGIVDVKIFSESGHGLVVELEAALSEI